MNTSSAYTTIAVAVLAVIAIVVLFVRGRKPENRITPLASLAFAFIMAGFLFGKHRPVGYGLLGIGVILAVVDIFNRSKSKSD